MTIVARGITGVALVLGGCDYVLGLERNIDAAPDAPVDAPPMCSEPALDQYKIGTQEKWNGAAGESIFHPAFAPGGLVYYGTAGGNVYRAPFEATGADPVLTNQDPTLLYGPAITHDGKTMFISRRSPTPADYVDVARWDLTDTTMSNVRPASFVVDGDKVAIETGNAGFYAETHRMVVGLPVAGGTQLIEMQSTDLDTWIEVEPPTITWALPTATELDASLSTDGCVLLFSSRRGGASTAEIFYSWRDAQGLLVEPRKLALSSPVLYDRSPVLSADGRLWFLRGMGVNLSVQELIVATAP